MGEGGVDIYGYNEVKDHIQLLLGSVNREIDSEIREKARNLKNGETMTASLNAIYARQLQHDNSDFTSALGAVQMLANGDFVVSKDSEGNLSYSGNAYYTMYDTYDWGPDKRATPLKTIMGIADHWQLNDLQRVGAKPFYSRAYFNGNIEGSGGGVRGTYSDTVHPIQLRSHPTPLKEINRLPTGTITTYDGRERK